jgi:Uma2 family endonuclease
MPGALHHGVVDDIHQGLTRLNIDNPSCACYHIADTYIQFGPKLLRRPDIALFCTRPPRPDGALTGIIPGAVVEVLSVGYEQKDRDAVPLYLSAGVQDVLLVDPRANSAERHTKDAPPLVAPLPVQWRLFMGCVIEMPRVVSS